MKPNKGASRTPSSGLSRPDCVPGTGCFGGASNASSLSYLAEPPSFSTVSDPNLVVSLKNVMKKDSTTKTKALEDLVHYVLAHPFGEGAGVEEALLEIWAQLYPRLSVDSSRRVRKLSHGLQLQLIKSARKRMKRYIPRIVGPWLSGLYDRDRAVVRTAQESLSLFLNTHERIVMFWSKCQSYILDYAIEAAQETQDTLSDDRTTSAEDSEAKYHRVMAASLSLVLGLLQSDTNVVEKSREKLDIFFAQDTVWKSVTFRDSQVRKTTCQVLLTCLDRHLSYAQSTKVKQAFVTGGLKITQSGSALEYVQALTKLTQHDPALWAADTSKKKPPLSRLGVFIAKGSQGSPANYWECLNELLASLPKEKWTLEDASRLLTSIKTGITNRDEPRSNASLSWQCYVDATQQCLNALSDENKLALTKQHLLPLFEQSLFSPSEKLVSLPPGSSAPSSILANVHFGLVQASSCLAEAIAEEWNRLGVILSKEIAASSSEASTEFGAAQLRIAEKSRRWFGFVGLLHGDPKRVVSISDCTTGPSEKVILQCITRLKNRDLKLEGAALTLNHALRTASHLFAAETGQELVRFLASTASDGMEKLAEPASPHGLFSCLDMLGTVPSLREKYENIWQLWTQSALGLSPQLLRNKALSRLLSQDKASLLAIKNQRLQEEIRTLANTFVCSDETKLKESVVDVLQTAVSSQALTVDTSQKIVRDMVALLQSETACTESILTVLEILARRQPNLLSSLEAIHTDLVSRLLSLTETTGEIKASLTAARIRSLLGSQGGDALPVIEIIRANLDRAGPQSLEIGTLAMQAQKAIENSVPRENVLPNTKLWLMQLAPLLERPVSSHLSVTSAIGGAVTLARTKSTSQAHMPRDRQGRSIPARMALYTQRVLSAAPGDANLPSQLHAELLHLQCVSMQLASDQVACLGKDGLWSLLDEASVVEAEEFVWASRDMVTRFVASALSERDKASETRLWSILVGLLQLFMTEAEELTPRGVYSARALAEVIQAAMEIQGATRALEELLPGPENLKSSSKTALVAAGLISGFGESLRSSKAINNFSNRLVSDVAVLSPADDRSRMTLVLLTCCAQIYETGEFPIAKNRVVFAVKQMISWTEEPDNLDADFCAEICRALTYLLPCIKDVYGPQWETSLRFCAGLWQNASRKMLAEISPWIHASLKLWRTLEELKDANDDLEDALKDLSASKYHGLVELMRIPREQGPQAMDIVDAMLYREVDKIPVASLPESMELLPLVASASRDIQTAAFTMLHKKIPAQQEELSIRVILDKTNAQLPDELLSLLLNPPMAEQYSDEALVQFPMPIRCYLLSWKLVFDAFSASSDKVCQDLTEHVKKGGLVKPLLDLLVGVLGHTAGQPLKLDKEKMGPETICTYDVRLAEAETSERSMHWLLAHLYYLTLRHVPGLFKAWYTDCRSKQTRMAVEAWTAKYFSPLVVADALDKVQQWASAQEPVAGGDDKELIIKVSKAVGEVTAGYEVDESQATIAIRPTADYPIGGVTVVGLRRVAVTERKWQSWIMTTQGAIAFSHGSIVAGLQVFQRNVVGALKGQSECAICYSIISTDQRMPDKRCSTCKNTFHRTCLYRWFQTSNQNTCPLCRNPIDYLGADTAKRKQG